MSIALDLALIIRNSKTKFNLSAATLGVAYTLAFRIGNNSMTWVSQSTLAKEIGLSESNVRIHCNKLKKSKLIMIRKDTSDKRKNLYSFNPVLVNYHQMNTIEKKKCHLILSDTFEDTAYFQSVNTAQNQSVLSEESIDQVIDNKKEIRNYPQPKVKEESKIKNKDKEKSVDKLEKPKSLKEEIWNDFKEFRQEKKNPLTYKAEKIALKRLFDFERKGFDVNQIVETSILNSWMGIFEPKQKNVYTKDKQQCSGCKRTKDWCICNKSKYVDISNQSNSYNPWRC